MIDFVRHASIDAFDVLDNELVVGGVTITRLAARVGGTPFYAYSRDAIGRRVAMLREVLPDAVQLHYAMKANPMPAVVQHLASLTDGLDVASAQEMQVALDTGTDAREISFAGPGKSAHEISQAVAAGITINLESESQYQMALSAASQLGIAPRLAIRVNPAFELKSSGMKMAGGPKPFGIDEARVPDLLSRMRVDDCRPVGFHIYSGSQNLSAAALIESQQKVVDLAISLAEHTQDKLEWVNIGGGFGVAYFPGEKTLDLRPVGEALAPLSQRAEDILSAPLVLELGRYLVAEAGVYVCRVLDCKHSHDQAFVMVDGGLHHNLAASGNFGQVIRKNYPVLVANRIGAPETAVQSFHGPLCTPLDILADKMDLPIARVGDLVAVFMGGAYGPSASPRGFLSHPDVREVLV